MYVSSKQMDEIWQKVGAMRTDQISAMQKRHRKDQKTLTKFTYAHLLELTEEAAGIGLYIFHVVVEAFSSLTPRPKAVRRPAIDRVWELSAATLAHMALSAEPHVTRYLEEALAEEDEVVLTNAEWFHCASVVHATIVVLHGACGNTT